MAGIRVEANFFAPLELDDSAIVDHELNGPVADRL
jgi:hypothetical protein